MGNQHAPKHFRIDFQVHPDEERNYDLVHIVQTMEAKNLNGIGLLEYGW